MLKQIQIILDQEKFECSLINATEESPQDHLIIFLGTDGKNREKILEITAQEQILNPEKKPSARTYYRIQFKYLFPFQVKDEAFNQVAGLVLFLNQQVDFPGLELNELENMISYRYVWLTKGGSVDSMLVLSIIGIIRLLLELFSESLERLAEGQATFNELLEEIIQMAQGAKKAP
ncbi:MAG: hypothetical protein H0W88_12615 [Parachlamydiaceae bacterium]|nr:hypothetical protein [Parachlamydiaceae bacterium]